MIGQRYASARGLRGAGILLLVMLGACTASPTPYQSATDHFGYSEQQIEENRHRVAFAGNSATSRNTVENYLLYRAAELTVANGYDYFTVVDQDIEASGSGVASPRVGVGVGSGGGNVGLGVGLSTFLGDGGSARYTAFADVVMYRGDKPEGDITSYDAREVLRRLEPQIERSGT